MSPKNSHSILSAPAFQKRSMSRPPKQSESILHFATDVCPLGNVLIARVCEGDSAKGICFLSLGDDPSSQLSELADAFPNHTTLKRNWLPSGSSLSNRHSRRSFAWTFGVPHFKNVFGKA